MATQPLSQSRTTISQLQINDVEEKIIIEQVKDTHNPNGGIDVDANCLLKFVEDIFNINTDSESDEDNSEKEDESSNEDSENDEDDPEEEGSDEHGKSETVPREAMQDRLQLQEHIQKEISLVVLQLSFVITFTCVSYEDSHSTAIYLLSLLSKYMWHVKGVMLLACFAIIRGKLKVVSQSCHQKGLPYNMTTLRKSVNSMLSTENEIFLNDSIKSMFDLTKIMIELRYSSSMSLANYWIAKSIVAYAHLLILNIETQNQIMTELSNASTKIKEILASSLPLLEAKRAEDKYQALLHAFDNSSNILDVLKLIFNVKNNKEKPILKLKSWREHRSMGLDEFEGEGVLLLISSGKHFPYYAYHAASTGGVKKIWVPIINDLDEHIQMSDDLYHNNLYRVLDSQKWIAPEFVRFLKNKCFSTFQVGEDPIVISLDKRGRLVHSNALHMIFTWGYQLSERRTMRSDDIIPSLENELREKTSGAEHVIDDIDEQIYNFARNVRKKINDWMKDIEKKMKNSFRSYNYTREREQELWLKESWNLKLVVGTTRKWKFQDTLNWWINDDENYIFLCGGNNITRVLEFVQKVRSKSQMYMKIAYVGRRRKMIEEVSRVCDYAFKHYEFKIFWARLHSVASSRIQYLSKVGLDERSDEILQGLVKLLSYEDECTAIGSWALLGKGKRIIGCDMGDKMLGVLNEYEKWKNNAHANDFEQAFKDYYEMLNTSSSSSSNQHSCCALNYPSNLDKIPDTVSCPQCNHNMHKFVTFSCCHGPTNFLYYEQDEDYKK
ncbi:PREDICTED: protein SIEVE ELEMENT OCCLUSION B-like isoform X1 [Ipomoea nil]|uniref:protein SIEVE ELEMENT OCCLUSION B-like isoform X1 n=1 Tax=Ipomoea nil TaxID=35883 RepID=UPI00090149D8|nr:PREDICTED: protein SIEVE ELEMENT OCCLUSION B-like isoform X1 [Ipomoea nil]